MEHNQRPASAPAPRRRTRKQTLKQRQTQEIIAAYQKFKRGLLRAVKNDDQEQLNIIKKAILSQPEIINPRDSTRLFNIITGNRGRRTMDPQLARSLRNSNSAKRLHETRKLKRSHSINLKREIIKDIDPLAEAAAAAKRQKDHIAKSVAAREARAKASLRRKAPGISNLKSMDTVLGDLFPDLQKSPSEEDREIKRKKDLIARLKGSRAELYRQPRTKENLKKIEDLKKEQAKIEKLMKTPSVLKAEKEAVAEQERLKRESQINARDKRARRPRVPPRSPARAWEPMDV